MNERQILEMLSYLRAIDEKLAAIVGILQKTFRHSHHPDILPLPDERVGIPEGGA
jgi:hypothetical protein